MNTLEDELLLDQIGHVLVWKNVGEGTAGVAATGPSQQEIRAHLTDNKHKDRWAEDNVREAAARLKSLQEEGYTMIGGLAKVLADLGRDGWEYGVPAKRQLKTRLEESPHPAIATGW